MHRNALILGVLVVAGCGSYQSSAPSRPTTARQPSTRPTTVHLALPGAWSSQSFSGGLGSDPFGLRVLVAANVPLPASVTECEALIPSLSRKQVVVRIYDYGRSPLAPRARRVGVIRPGAVSPFQQQNGQTGGFNETRVNYHGHTLVIDTNYGSAQPIAAVRGQVAALLRSIRMR